MGLYAYCVEKMKTIPEEATLYNHLGKLMEEVGELAEEISIDQGYVNKPSGEDGILGEACDVIICAFAIINKMHPTLSDRGLEAELSRKYLKWREHAIKKNS